MAAGWLIQDAGFADTGADRPGAGRVQDEEEFEVADLGARDIDTQDFLDDDDHQQNACHKAGPVPTAMDRTTVPTQSL